MKRLLCRLVRRHVPELRLAAYEFTVESCADLYPRSKYLEDIFPVLLAGLRVTGLRMNFKTLCARCDIEIRKVGQ